MAERLLLVLHDQPFFALFGVVAIGMALGRLKLGGLSFGSVIGIILAGLLTSLWASSAYGISLAIPEIVKTIFFNLFLFAVALRIGPQFFAGLKRDGLRMLTVGGIVAVLAPLLSCACGRLFSLPPGSVAGLLAGANNSSAAFGAASTAVASGAARLRGSSLEEISASLSASFALTYLVAEIAFVLFMKYLPALARIDAPGAERAFEADMRKLHPAPLPGTAEAGDVDDASVAVRAYRVTASAAVGRTLADVHRAAPRVAVERIRRDGRWLTPDEDTALQKDDELVVVGRLGTQLRVREAVGPELADAEARDLIPIRTVDVVVGRKEAAGRTLQELTARIGPGLYPHAVFRAGQELPAGPRTELAPGDVIRVTGAEPHLAELGSTVGHVVQASHLSDILWLSVGLLVGAGLGAIPVPFFGVTVKLGAAAILIAGIVISWLKTRHPALGGTVSEGGRSFIEDLGLNVFTAALGLNAGETLLQVLRGGSLWGLVISCLIVTLVPAMVACWIGLGFLKLNPAVLLGALAGARQCTASLKVAQQLAQGSAPAIGYPVPLAITTVALSIEAYVLAAFF